MTTSEFFLMAWAVFATIYAFYNQAITKRALLKLENTSNLLCDVVVGDVKGKKDSEGYWTVENSHTRITFKRVTQEI